MYIAFQDLDAETAAHIEADCLAQTKTEEAEFYKDLLDQVGLQIIFNFWCLYFLSVYERCSPYNKY